MASPAGISNQKDRGAENAPRSCESLGGRPWLFFRRFELRALFTLPYPRPRSVAAATLAADRAGPYRSASLPLGRRLANLGRSGRQPIAGNSG